MVRVSSDEEASWIIQNLNGNIPQGLQEPIEVKPANTPESKGGYGKAGGKGGG